VGGELRIGCSGWDYAEWVGRFYPLRGTVDRLRRYAQTFPVVEVDSSFYHLPTIRTVEGWARRTPAGFRFAAKFFQEITHERRLEGAEEALREQYRVFEPLREAGKLSAFLLQLPPSLAFDERVVRRFYEALPPDPPVAVEFRERSWLAPASLDLLREFHLSTTIVDEPLLPVDLTLTNPDLAYVRWHGHGSPLWYDYTYSEDELRPWVARLAALTEKARTVLGFFNNHFRADAPQNALELSAMVGLRPPAWSGRLDLPTIPRGTTQRSLDESPE
jgi:uncharacterized protein YecE (DUF72 family)